MKKLFTLALLVALVVTLWSCSSRRQAEISNDNDEVVSTLIVNTFTQRDTYPGIPSNLIKTRNFRVVFQSNYDFPVKVEGLRMDSVLLRTYDLVLTRTNKRGKDITIDGGRANVDVSFSRYIMESYTEEEQYESLMEWQDEHLAEGVYELVLATTDGRVFTERLDAPQALEPLFAP